MRARPCLMLLAAAAVSASAATGPDASARKSPYRPIKLTMNAKNYYVAAWGIDRLKVTHTASGNLIRFSYRVTEPGLAQVISDKKATPYLYAPRSNAILHVPVMDKVGQLRQTGTQKAGQEYWMVFSNKGNLVKPGDRVTVIVGAFRAEGLMVE